MPIRAARLALVFLAMLGLAGPARAHETTLLYPVWWSDELELESLDQVDQRLRRDLWPDSTEGFTLFKGAPDNYVTVQGHSCESLSRLTEEGYDALSTNDRWALNHQLSDCRAIALLAQAKPARVSHLRDFVLNAGALDYLPALLNLQVSCQFTCYAVEANERGIPFAKFETVLVVDVENEEIVVWAPGWMVRLTILARGDFTADGVDDMLLISSGGATEGSWKTARLYLMTRDAPSAVLRVIDAEQELCPDYGCHPFPRDFVFVRDSSPPPAPAHIGGSPGPPQPGSTVAEDTPPYPVWWSYGFDLESLDGVDARLRRNFRPGSDKGIRLYKGSYENYVEAEARTCIELEALTQAGYGSFGSGFDYFQLYHLFRCRTVVLLGTARPARESFLRDFVISQESSRDLLLALGLVIGVGVSSQSGEMALTRGLGQLLAVDLIRAASGEADVWAEQGRVRIRIEARGDFTGNGIEDLLLSAGTTRSRYRPKISDLCLITREAADSPLRLIEVAPYSCREPGKYGRPADENDPN